MAVERYEWHGITGWGDETGTLELYAECGEIVLDVWVRDIALRRHLDAATARDVARTLIELADGLEREE